MWIKGESNSWVNLDRVRDIAISSQEEYWVWANTSDDTAVLLKKVTTLKEAEKYVERLLRRMRKG